MAEREGFHKRRVATTDELIAEDEERARKVNEYQLTAPAALASHKKFNESEKGRELQRRHRETGKPTVAQKKHYEEGGGREYHQDRQATENQFEDAARWIEKNPGKTFEDYLNKIAEESQDELA